MAAVLGYDFNNDLADFIRQYRELFSVKLF